MYHPQICFPKGGGIGTLSSTMKYLVVVVFALFGVPSFAHAESLPDIAFPVNGDVTFTDTFTAPRSGGRVHHATDIMGEKMMPLLAAVDGVILFAPMEEPSYGYMIMLGGDDGYQYNYVHINNDTPGTDDGLGGPAYAYAPGIAKGVRVTRGQHIAYLGDSGNAEWTADHLHFEILDPNNEAMNPYPVLLAAQQRVVNATFSFNPEEEVLEATSISDDLGLKEADDEAACTADSLIRTATSTTVYYCGRDGGRYVFQDEGTYFSWYSDFRSVVTVSDEVMGSIPLRGSVTYKPGSYLLKLPSVSKVYAVGAGGTLHWIPSAEIADALYGADWAKMVRDLPESFYPAYTLGEAVTESTE
jgi:hypothetical protein